MTSEEKRSYNSSVFTQYLLATFQITRGCFSQEDLQFFNMYFSQVSIEQNLEENRIY